MESSDSHTRTFFAPTQPFGKNNRFQAWCLRSYRTRYNRHGAFFSTFLHDRINTFYLTPWPLTEEVINAIASDIMEFERHRLFVRYYLVWAAPRPRCSKVFGSRRFTCCNVLSILRMLSGLMSFITGWHWYIKNRWPCVDTNYHFVLRFEGDKLQKALIRLDKSLDTEMSSASLQLATFSKCECIVTDVRLVDTYIDICIHGGENVLTVRLWSLDILSTRGNGSKRTERVFLRFA